MEDGYKLIDCSRKIEDSGYSHNKRIRDENDYDVFYTLERNGEKFTMKVYNISLDAVFGKKLSVLEKTRLKYLKFPFPAILDSWECQGEDGVNHVLVMEYLDTTLENWLKEKQRSTIECFDLLKKLFDLIHKIHGAGYNISYDNNINKDIVLTKNNIGSDRNPFYEYRPYYINIKKLEKINTTAKDSGENFTYMSFYTLIPNFLKLIADKIMNDNLELAASEYLSYSESQYFKNRNKSPIDFRYALENEHLLIQSIIKAIGTGMDKEYVYFFEKQGYISKEKEKEESIPKEDENDLNEEELARLNDWIIEREPYYHEERERERKKRLEYEEREKKFLEKAIKEKEIEREIERRKNLSEKDKEFFKRKHEKMLEEEERLTRLYLEKENLERELEEIRRIDMEEELRRKMEEEERLREIRKLQEEDRRKQEKRERKNSMTPEERERYYIEKLNRKR